MGHDYRAIANRVYDAFNRNDGAALEALFASDFVEHEEFAGVSGVGLETAKAFAQAFHTGFPDFKIRLLDVIGEGGRTCAWYRLTGTQWGEFAGLAPTGRSVDIQGFDWLTLDDDGLITEHWGVSQELAMMTQLGLAPDQPAATIDLTEPAATHFPH
jgi:steroid delta-isomerase-like uncharacterized protein